MMDQSQLLTFARRGRRRASQASHGDRKEFEALARRYEQIVEDMGRACPGAAANPSEAPPETQGL